MTNPVMPLDPAGAPDPVTPAGSPSDPAGYARVTPAGQGPAPYSIQAPMQDLSALTSDAGALAGAGIVYPAGPRQSQTDALLSSPQGYGSVDGYNIDAGYSGGGGDTGWPNDVDPGANIATPDQGTGDFQGTGTD